MRRGAQRDAIARNGRIVCRRGVQQIGAVDFLRLREGFHEAQVRRRELRLVQVVVDRLARDRVAKADFDVLLIVDEALAGVVVELNRAALGLELREPKEPHFGGAFQRHVRVCRLEHLVPLRGNLRVLSFDAPEAGKEKVADGGKIDSHLPVSLRNAGRSGAVGAQDFIVEADDQEIVVRRGVGSVLARRVLNHVQNDERIGDGRADAGEIRAGNAG